MIRMTLAGLLMTVCAAVPASARAWPNGVRTPPPAQSQAPPPTQSQTPPPAQSQVPPLLPPQTLSPAAPAKAPLPFPADGKVAVFDMQAVVSKSKLGQAGSKKLNALRDQKNVELSAKSKAIQALQQQIQQQNGVLSAQALQQKQADLDKLQREGQYAQQEAQAALQALYTQLSDDFQAKVLKVVEGLRAEKELWAVFSVSDAGLAAVHRGLDVTADVIKRLDASYPAEK